MQFLCQYKPCPSWILCQKIYRSGWSHRNLGSPFSIDPRVHCPQWVLTGHNRSSIYKVCVLFPPSISILYIVQLKSPSIICFHFPYFYFHIILLSFKETPPSHLFLGAIPWRGINTENSVIRESNLKGYKLLFYICVNLCDTFNT